MRSVFYLQEGYMRKIIIILCCVLVFTGCGAAPQQNTVTDTEVPSGTEEILPDLSGIEMPDEIPQELTETDLRIMRSIVKVQAGDLYGSGVIYDADEESVLILTAGHVLDQNTGEILVTFPDDTQARAALRAIAVNSDLAFLRVLLSYDLINAPRLSPIFSTFITAQTSKNTAAIVAIPRTTRISRDCHKAFTMQ